MANTGHPETGHCRANRNPPPLHSGGAAADRNKLIVAARPARSLIATTPLRSTTAAKEVTRPLSDWLYSAARKLWTGRRGAVPRHQSEPVG